MEVKGLAIDAIRKFVVAKFDKSGADQWLAVLPPASKAILNGMILATNWYPARDGLFVPTQMVCDLFFKGDKRGAWELGRFSAETALNSVYKMVLRFASPDVIVEKSVPIVTNYYRTMTATVEKVEPKHYMLRLSGMDDPSPLIELRIAGWCERCFQLCRVKDVKSEIVRSARDAKSASEIHVSWS